jgi:hypothetical protein
MSLLNPAFEKTDNAGQYMSDLRTTAYKHSVAVLAIHHVRKPGKDGVPALDQEDPVLMEWLNQASGHRSIINQSDTRIATGLPKQPTDAAMVLRWHRRMKGWSHLPRKSIGRGRGRIRLQTDVRP